ncbi:MAG: GNAT family N-acetyltransferase [Burkholderiales bacterium]|nr:GNAT family N-acetyltransferase [Burkholderiales bacterium]
MVRLTADDALLGEAGRLFDAYRQFYEQPSDIDAATTFLAQRLARKESVVVLAMQGNEAVGLMQLYPTFCSVALAPIWVLYDLFTAPSARGQGVAQALLDEARQLGKTSGAAYLQLSTAHTNTTAQRVYEAHGWVMDSVFRTYTLAL